MNDHSFFERIAGNVREVRDRIAAAAKRSGRNESDVTLVAVSKYAATGDPMFEAFCAAECFELGEARPQLLLEKAEFYRSKPIHWHLIGSLQRNKVRKILPVTTLIHSLDSLRLAEAINRIVDEEVSEKKETDFEQKITPVHCLLEIAISGDENKHGFEPEEMSEVMEKLAPLKNIAVEGLMCMSGLDADASATRRQFEAVRKIAENLRRQGTPDNISMDRLSMGMSDDFEIAVEEGATLVRVGSVLYG